MWVRRAPALCLAFALVFFCFSPVSAQENHSNRIFGTITGRFHCDGEWRDFQMGLRPVAGPLGIADEDEPSVTGGITFYFHRSVTSLDGATYMLAGTRDAKTGRFHVEAKEWSGPHPASLGKYGMEGTLDAKTGKVTGKMLSDRCDALEFAGPDGKLPPLPEKPGPVVSAADAKRPEMQVRPTNVTNYLDVAAYNPDFQFVETRAFDPPGTVHGGEPIDEMVERLKSEKWVCGGSQHITWEAGGSKGTAPDRVGVTERYVVECAGDCKGVLYRPWIGANVTHFGLSYPLPMMQIKSVWFGGTSFSWRFSRTSNTQPPPDIYVHRWTPLFGFGPLDPVPAEIARRQAAAPPCRSPRAKS
jgi:hypothetical protein